MSRSVPSPSAIADTTQRWNATADATADMKSLVRVSSFGAPAEIGLTSEAPA